MYIDEVLVTKQHTKKKARNQALKMTGVVHIWWLLHRKSQHLRSHDEIEMLPLLVAREQFSTLMPIAVLVQLPPSFPLNLSRSLHATRLERGVFST